MVPLWSTTLQKGACVCSYLLTYSLLCLISHRTRTSFLHSSLLLAFLSIVPQVYPLSFISFSMVRLHVVFDLPLFLFPSGVHLRATFVMSSDGLRRTSLLNQQSLHVRGVCTVWLKYTAQWDVNEFLRYGECQVPCTYILQLATAPYYDNVTKFVSDLRQVGGFLRVLRFPPPIKLIAMI